MKQIMDIGLESVGYDRKTDSRWLMFHYNVATIFTHESISAQQLASCFVTICARYIHKSPLLFLSCTHSRIDIRSETLQIQGHSSGPGEISRTKVKNINIIYIIYSSVKSRQQ